MLISFRKPFLQYSLGFISLHYVIHSFQDYSIHPLYLLLRSPLRAPCCVTMLRWHTPWLITSLCHAAHLHCLSITPYSRFTVQPAGAARKTIPFVPLSIVFWRRANIQMSKDFFIDINNEHLISQFFMFCSSLFLILWVFLKLDAGAIALLPSIRVLYRKILKKWKTNKYCLICFSSVY